MSAAALPTPVDRPRRPGQPKRWTADEYLALCQAGFVLPEDRMELIEGEIIEKMGQDFPHIDGITLLVEALRTVYGAGFLIRSQLPLRAGDSVPEPDVCVLRGTARDFVGRFPKPEEVVLVAEVSNTTLAGDRERKGKIYAGAGFAEYWILDVANRRLEVCRTPLPSGAYGEIRLFGESESVDVGGASIQVADLLP